MKATHFFKCVSFSFHLFSGGTIGVCYLSAYVVTGKMFPDNSSFYLISLTLGNSLGQFIVPLLFEVFIARYTWSGTFILIAGVTLQCVPCGLVINYSKRYFPKRTSISSDVSSIFCDKSLLTDVVIWMLILNIFLHTATGR